MNSGNYHVTVNTEAGAYEFDLVKTDAQHAALTFGGTKYSIIAADPLKQSTINKIINSADIQNAGTIREFAGRLKHVSSVSDVRVSTTEKAHGVASSIIVRKPLEDVFTLEQERQFGVEHGLRPGVPVPGINTEKPMTIGERMKDLGVPGASITVINNGRIAWSKNYGVMDSPEVTSQAASISKVVTALTTLSIIKQCQTNPATLLNGRKIDLNTPIGKCLDATLLSHIDPKGLCKEITIQHLLQHTSGIVLRDKIGEPMTGFQGYPRSADELDKEIKELEEQVKSRAASEPQDDACRPLPATRTSWPLEQARLCLLYCAQT